ncbi:hypothetical protein STSP2_01205 [Anaerohalosphaera lusitana]|uniref:Uncharacterized protein n=1 Tax=Anaerohalosphaera lusitana TaxID=1936003 RepID=A0A1U9NJG0_9BACT|nr:hypothetical protein [Anaerohalosphaera lusitana]AQT68051.1 hypothetical protein STSP2_01205 [Anaerohalosphaera lusitana]
MKNNHPKYITIAKSDDRELLERLLKLLNKKSIDAQVITADPADTPMHSTLKVAEHQYDTAYDFVQHITSRGCTFGLPHVKSSKRPDRKDRSSVKQSRSTQVA